MQFASSVIEKLGRRPLNERSVRSARSEYGRLPMVFDRPVVDLPRVRDRRVPGAAGDLAARIYDPGGRNLPVMLFFHGGGGVVGGLETHDGLCRRLARDAHALVLATDYRLAPEAPHPAAHDDARAVYAWAREHAGDLGDTNGRVAVAGDSMGAHLSIAVTHRARDAGDALPDAQVLIYPPTDLGRATRSFELFEDGFFLTRPLIEWFESHFLGDTDRDDPDVSPLRRSSFDGLPPTIVVTAGFDPLRDEGDAYAQALQDAGVSVWHRSYDELVHGFAQMSGTNPAARRAVWQIADQTRRWLRA